MRRTRLMAHADCMSSKASRRGLCDKHWQCTQQWPAVVDGHCRKSRDGAPILSQTRPVSETMASPLMYAVISQCTDSQAHPVVDNLVLITIDQTLHPESLVLRLCYRNLHNVGVGLSKHKLYMLSWLVPNKTCRCRKTKCRIIEY